MEEINNDNESVEESENNSIEYNNNIKTHLNELKYLINCLFSADSNKRNIGKHAWLLFSRNKEASLILFLGYLDSKFSQKNQDYCLVLLKQYFIMIFGKQQPSDYILEQAKEIYNCLLIIYYEVLGISSNLFVDLLSVLIRLITSDTHNFIDVIFLRLKIDTNYPLPSYLLLKQILIDIPVMRNNNFLFIMTRYMPEIFSQITNMNTIVCFKIYACSCIRKYLIKIEKNKSLSPDVYADFSEIYRDCYNKILKVLSIHYEPSGDVYLYKLLKIIWLLLDKLYEPFLRCQTLTTCLQKVVKEIHTTNGYAIDDLTCYNLGKYNDIIKYVIMICFEFVNNNSQFEMNLIKDVIIYGIDLIRIDTTRSILDVYISDEVNEVCLEEEFDSLLCYNVLRGLYIKLFDKKHYGLNKNCIEYLYLKICENIKNCTIISLPTSSNNSIHWKSIEAYLWVISCTIDLYLHDDILNMLIKEVNKIRYHAYKSHDNIDNTLIYWRAIITLSILYKFKPIKFDIDIINEIIEILMKLKDNKIFHLYNCCIALQNICIIVKYSVSNEKYLLNRVKDIIDILVASCDNVNNNRLIVIIVETIKIMLINSHVKLSKILTEKIVTNLFNLLKEYYRNPEICRAYIKLVEKLLLYTNYNKIHIQLIYNYIIGELKRDINKLEYNYILCELIIMLIDNISLSYEEICQLFIISLNLTIKNDEKIILSLIQIFVYIVYQYNDQNILKLLLNVHHNTIYQLVFQALQLNDIQIYHNLLQFVFVSFTQLPISYILPIFTTTILFEICKIIQVNDSIITTKQIPIVLLSTFVLYDTERTMNFLIKLPGIYFNYALEDIFYKWFNLHNDNYFHIFYYRLYSIYTLCHLLEYCSNNIELNSIFSNNNNLYIKLEILDKSIKLSIKQIILLILLLEYINLKYISFYKLLLPTELNKRYWINITDKLQYYDIIKLLNSTFNKIPKDYFQSIKMFFNQDDYNHIINRFFI